MGFCTDVSFFINCVNVVDRGFEFPDQVLVVSSPRGFGMVLFYYLCERRLQFD